jgi:FKBP-type peptidyl-prolyl cis-trans isomerase
MLKKINAVILIFLFIGCSNSSKVPEEVELRTWQDSVSYSIGADLGNVFNVRGINFEINSFARGFNETIPTDSSYAYGASIASNFILQGVVINSDIFLNAFQKNNTGDSLLLSETEMRQILDKYDQMMRDAIAQRQKEILESKKVEGDTFIESYLNMHDDEIKTESGLVYRVLKEGYGKVPTLEDKVVVHYIGRLIDGTVFDSSIDRGEPSTFRIAGVIQGWQEALTLMPVGSKWELVIPSILGYGERSTGNIPGMSTLIFEVELLGIE